MGIVKTKVTLTNFVDQKMSERRVFPPERVRRERVEMLVDTGATMLVVGEDLAERLGIEKEDEILIRLADDSVRSYHKGRGVLVEIDGRNCVTDCVILEKGVQPLLGQIPLEEMDLIVDCKNQRLIPNPESPEGKVLILVK